MNNSGKVSIKQLAVVGTTLLSILIILALVFPSVPSIVPSGFLSARLSEPVLAYDEGDEILESRTANTKKYFLGYTDDGKIKYALNCSMGAIHYEDGNGNWQDIDTSYEEGDSGNYTVKFTKLWYLARVGNDSRRRIYPDRNDLSYWIEFHKPFQNMPEPTRQDRWFYWSFTNAILGIRFDSTSVKFGFRLKNENAPSSITIPFTTQGITRQGRFLYHDGAVIGELRIPIATDAEGTERECDVSFGSGDVTVSLNTTGLVYPIDIDPEVDLDVAASADDGWEKESNGAVSITDTVVIMYSSTVDTSRCWGGFRWDLGEDGPIPQGSEIIKAYATLYVYDTYNDDPNCNLHFEEAASPAQFTTTTSDITDRDRTEESVSWIDTGLGAGWEQTPGGDTGLVTPLQEVVDSYSPTAIVLITRPNQDQNLLFACYAWNYNDHSYAAQLYVEWEESSTFTPRVETYADVSSLSSPYDLSIDKPSGTEDGDILFNWVGAWIQTVDSVPSGWTLLSSYTESNDNYYLYYKIADSEPSSWNWSFTGSAYVRMVCSCYTNGAFDSSDPIDVVSTGSYRTSDTTVRAASISVSAANSPLVFWAGFCNGSSVTFTKPSNPTGDWVEDDDAGSTTSQFWTEICSMVWTGSGSTGNMDATASVSNVYKHGFAVALNPPSLITNTPSSKDFGIIQVNGTSSTTINYFTLNNTGTCAVDVTIQGTNATGGDDTWILSNNATPGNNIYGLKAGLGPPVLYEYYITGKDAYVTCYGDYWKGQTFTPSTTHNIIGVNLTLARFGSPGEITVSIRATDELDKITGGDLCVGTTDGDTLTTDLGGEWRYVQFDNDYQLSTSTMYGIVIRALDGDADDNLRVCMDSTSAAYAGGYYQTSGDGGSSWVLNTDRDLMFEEYGGNYDVVVNTTANAFVGNLAQNATQGWGLRIYMPTSVTGYDGQSMNATITLVASGSS